MWSGVHEASKASRGEAAYKRFPLAENLGAGGLCLAAQNQMKRAPMDEGHGKAICGILPWTWREKDTAALRRRMWNGGYDGETEADIKREMV